MWTRLVSTLIKRSKKSGLQYAISPYSTKKIAEVREYFQQFEGGSVALIKNDLTGIATIVLNNPGKKNALTGKMMVDLDGCVTELETWKAGKGVVLTGAGNTFCSGGDLVSIQKNMKKAAEMSDLMHSVTSRLFNLPMISLAAIDGHALGGGAELATSCDFRIMSKRAKIGFVQVKLNIAPGWGGCTRLVKLLGRTKTLQLLSSGAILNAEDACKIGLANDIVNQDGDIVEHGVDWLKNNCCGDATALATIKQMVLAGLDHDELIAMEKEKELFKKVWGSTAHLDALSQNKKHK